MDEDGIGLVLARASELRSKITNCIHKASSSAPQTHHHDASNGEREAEEDKNPLEDDDEQEEAESLLNIRDALESLEAQLSSLQALQQQQWYEKGAALAEIDNSRKKLLTKLKEYKGEDLEVIHEATAFASETVDDNNNDLLLPPYPSRPSHSLPSDNGYLSHFASNHKLAQNGLTNGDSRNERNQVGPRSRISLKRARNFISAVAKTVVTIVGVISVLSMAGFEPRLRKRDVQLKVLGLQGGSEESRVTTRCPPGKVLVVEDGETRCLVKERVEIPFESVASMPDVSYGCG
ncbi:hypothetical protein LguiB_022203 [Lonicera macranthoides]